MTDATPPESLLARRPLLVGMVHLPPLPGAPGASPARTGTPPAFLERARADAGALATAGFDAVLLENFGDTPFFADRVPPATVAALAAAATAVRGVLPEHVALGINVLRNDALAALGVAAATGAAFVRVNVLAGAYLTDQGVIEGRAAEVARSRAALAPDVRLVADLRVKHARPLAERPLHEEARELVERAGADAVVVSGPATGAPADAAELEGVRVAIGDHPLLVGSGVEASSVGEVLRLADGVIVGTALKRGGATRAPVDPARARAFVEAARG